MNTQRKRKPSHSKQQFGSKRRPSGNNRNNNRNGNSRKKVKTLNPTDLVKKALEPTISNTYTGRKFSDLELDVRLQKNISFKGYKNTTEIQDRSIDHQLNGGDILGIANTGSGKTGAFLIPIIDRWLRSSQKPKTLILVPTRELALQVQEEFQSLSYKMNMYNACFIGGTNINKDLNAAKRKLDLIVGTPGRILDLMDRRALKIANIDTLVLDEFDRMLDMGFIRDVRKITDGIRNREQTILFSATENKSQSELVDEFLNNPLKVRVTSGQKSADHIDQDILKIKEDENKFSILLDLISNEEFEKVIVFDETKRRVSRLAIKLRKSGVKTDDIHGDKSQNQRQNALKRFKSGQVKVLVATDVAARGIDVDDISHVINYQVPTSMESYIHRIGRTGRAGKTGKAITLVDPN